MLGAKLLSVYIAVLQITIISELKLPLQIKQVG